MSAQPHKFIASSRYRPPPGLASHPPEPPGPVPLDPLLPGYRHHSPLASPLAPALQALWLPWTPTAPAPPPEAQVLLAPCGRGLPGGEGGDELAEDRDVPGGEVCRLPGEGEGEDEGEEEQERWSHAWGRGGLE